MNNFLKLSVLGLCSIILLSCAGSKSHCPTKPSINHSIDSSQLLSDLKILSADAMQGRETGTQGNRKAQDFLVNRYKAIGLKSFYNNYKHSFQYGDNQSNDGTNIIGWLPGNKNLDQYIVITAHYDHIGSLGNKIFNGADDNASGVAAMLTIAQAIKDSGSAYSIIFVATDAEEKGLYGSKAFVKSPPIKLENIRYNVNLDMIARGGIKNRLYVSGTKNNKHLKNIVQMAAPEYGICLRRGHEGKERVRGSVSVKMDWSKVSDHAPFLKKKIPYLYFGVEPHPDYHQPSDTFDQVNPIFYIAAVETVITIFKRLDNENLVNLSSE